MTTPLEDLDRRQHAFLMRFMATGNAYQSALDAGYTDIVAAQAGDILLRNDRIKKALRHLRATHRESVRQQLRIASALAVGTLVDLVSDVVCPAAVRIQAAKEILASSAVANSDEKEDNGALDLPLDALPDDKVKKILIEGRKKRKEGK